MPEAIWLRDVQPLLGRVDLNLLKMVVPPGSWAPDFLFAWSPDRTITIEQQLEGVVRMPTEQLRADIESCWRQRQQPAALCGCSPTTVSRCRDWLRMPSGTTGR